MADERKIDDPNKVARQILKHDFTFDREELKRASYALREAGTKDDSDGIAYWRSVFGAVIDLWGNRECDMEEQHAIQTIAAYAEGDMPMNDQEIEELDKELEAYYAKK